MTAAIIRKDVPHAALWLCALIWLWPVAAPAAEPVKLAVILGLSGPFALQGEEAAKQFRGIADLINAQGGVLGGRPVEIVALDGKTNPQDSLLALTQAVGQNVQFVASAVTSVVHALSDAVAKHNERNPSRRVLLLTFDARDPAITEAKCNFWNFRFAPHIDVEMNFLTDYVARQKDLNKVYLLNQDYAYGHAVSRAARDMLSKKRADVRIVGDEFVPLGKVKDFAPYATKIRAAQADSIITGNWGNDLFLLVKAGHESGIKVRYYNFVPYLAGTATALGAASAGKVWGITNWHANAEPNPYGAYNADFKAKYKAAGNFDYLQILRTVEMLAQAIDKAQTTDPLKVSYALEGLKRNGPEGEAWMRAEDHQIVAPLYLASFAKAGQPGVTFDVENTGYGWKTEAKVEAKDAVPELKCKMERPTR